MAVAGAADAATRVATVTMVTAAMAMMVPELMIAKLELVMAETVVEAAMRARPGAGSASL